MDIYALKKQVNEETLDVIAYGVRLLPDTPLPPWVAIVVIPLTEDAKPIVITPLKGSLPAIFKTIAAEIDAKHPNLVGNWLSPRPDPVADAAIKAWLQSR
jgi:hypothetical protein